MREVPFPLLPRWLRYALVAAVAVVLLYFSVLTPPPVTPPDPGPFWDKKLHVLAYAALAGALAYATVQYRDRPWTRIAAVLLLSAGYGVGIEALQATRPARYASASDALANALGALLACAWFLVEPRLKYVPLPTGDATGDADS